MILTRLSSADELRAASGIFKYVRMKDGSFRFADIHGMPEHWQMVEDGEAVASAGTIRIDVRSKTASMLTYGSSTLGIVMPLNDDLEQIEALLWAP